MAETQQTLERPAPTAPASAYPREWIAEHLAEERRNSALLGEAREVGTVHRKALLPKHEIGVNFSE